MSTALTEKEIHFLLLLRNFDFLRSDGYSPKEFALYGRETFLNYWNNRIKQNLYIKWAPKNDLGIKIFKKSLFGGGEFELKDIFKYFDNDSAIKEPPMYIDMPDVIELNAKFIQQHLMPVIKGEIWIDELIKQRK
ncbi:MAG: hypothetical protein R2751_06965 [Bacteroidales bacterium]